MPGVRESRLLRRPTQNLLTVTESPVKTGYEWSAFYDAENKQRFYCDATTAACSAANDTAEYVYDGEGNRVQKITASEIVTYVYDAFGRLAAEYSTAGPSGPAGSNFRTTDHLGSTRLVTNGSGNVHDRRDFFPFGEQILASSTYSNRQNVTGYNNANPASAHLFTGKERGDLTTEGGLDYFIGRAYSSSLGRFVSADRVNITNDRLVGPSLGLNKYAYALNSPLFYTDPDGQDVVAFYKPSFVDYPGRSFSPTGHIAIVALNQATGDVESLDFAPSNRQVITGSTPQFNYNLTADRLRLSASFTVKTTPEEAQELITEIRRFKANPPNYTILGQNCVISCQEAFQVLGINVGGFFPRQLWQNLYQQFAPEALAARQRLGNPFAVIAPPRAEPGKDYGQLRFGDDIDLRGLILRLFAYRGTSTRACVSTDDGLGNGSTSCE